jgi:hypothetical protein
MWHLAGDKATDLNHYSKRATLAALYTSTLAVFAEDRSEDHAETRAFLDRRIGVMRFEKIKAPVQAQGRAVSARCACLAGRAIPPLSGQWAGADMTAINLLRTTCISGWAMAAGML